VTSDPNFKLTILFFAMTTEVGKWSGIRIPGRITMKS